MPRGCVHASSPPPRPPLPHERGSSPIPRINGTSMSVLVKVSSHACDEVLCVSGNSGMFRCDGPSGEAWLGPAAPPAHKHAWSSPLVAK